MNEEGVEEVGRLRRKKDEARSVLRRTYDFRGCAVCGIEIDSVLQAAHLDNNPSNNNPDNLAWLCPTHHWMTDHQLYPVEAVKMLRNHWEKTRAEANHAAVLKDAGAKAAATRFSNAAKRRGIRRQGTMF
jgi:predicted restriction endonuclease